MPKRVRKILEKVGDMRVVKLQLGRTPVQAVLLLILNVMSGWSFNKKQLELGYDEIYHNYLLVTVEDENEFGALEPLSASEDDTIHSNVYKLDKAHRVRLVESTSRADFVENYDIPLTPNKIFTLNRLITTASNVDKQFYTYDAGNNNMCQTFVENIVDINGLTPNIANETVRTALKPQDGRALVATLGSRSDIVKQITDLGGTLDTLVFDRRIKWKKPVEKQFALYGHMHVKIAHDAAEAVTADEILPDTNDVVVLNGTTDVFLENEDELYSAVLALERQDQKSEWKTKILLIIGIIFGILLLSVTAAIAFYYYYRRKKRSRLI